VSDDKELDRKRALGSLHATYEEHIRKLGPEQRAVVSRRLAIIETYHKIAEREEGQARDVPRTTPPGRHADVLALEPIPLLDEHAPRGDLFAKLTEVTKRETAQRAARAATDAAAVQHSGVTALATESPMRIGNL
jgi:hypothetical protein